GRALLPGARAATQGQVSHRDDLAVQAREAVPVRRESHLLRGLGGPEAVRLLEAPGGAQGSDPGAAPPPRARRGGRGLPSGLPPAHPWVRLWAAVAAQRLGVVGERRRQERAGGLRGSGRATG